jgi:transcriptional regulator with XRE-family HTH domain
MLGLTQEAAAGVLGMSRLTYHRIEIGRRHIHFTELGAICAAFNCHIGELVQDGQLADAFIYAAKALLGEAPANFDPRGTVEFPTCGAVHGRHLDVD